MSPRRSARGLWEPGFGAAEGDRVEVGSVAFHQQDQQRPNLLSSLWLRSNRPGNRSVDQNCQPSSLNMPSRGTHLTPTSAHTSGILGF